MIKYNLDTFIGRLNTMNKKKNFNNINNYNIVTACHLFINQYCIF